MLTMSKLVIKLPMKFSLVRPGMTLKKLYRKKDGMQMKSSKSSRKLIGCGLMSSLDILK